MPVVATMADAFERDDDFGVLGMGDSLGTEAEETSRAVRVSSQRRACANKLAGSSNSPGQHDPVMPFRNEAEEIAPLVRPGGARLNVGSENKTVQVSDSRRGTRLGDPYRWRDFPFMPLWEFAAVLAEMRGGSRLEDGRRAQLSHFTQLFPIKLGNLTREWFADDCLHRHYCVVRRSGQAPAAFALAAG